MVAICEERVPQGTVRVHDLGDPLHRLDDDSFDLVLRALAYEYVDDRVAAIGELRRVLRPSGALVLSGDHPTADWLRHAGSYVESRVIEETWSRGWQMRYWRTPLEQTCAEIVDAGSLIERLTEPRPTPDAAVRNPEDYERLQAAPGFLALRLVSRP